MCWTFSEDIWSSSVIPHRKTTDAGPLLIQINEWYKIYVRPQNVIFISHKISVENYKLHKCTNCSGAVITATNANKGHRLAHHFEPWFTESLMGSSHKALVRMVLLFAENKGWAVPTRRITAAETHLGGSNHFLKHFFTCLNTCSSFTNEFCPRQQA